MGLVTDSNSRIESVIFDASLTIEQHGIVCAAAETYGVDAWGPLPTVLPLKVARAQGQRTLVGLDSLLPRGQRFETLPDDFDGPIVEDLRAGEWQVVPLLLGTGRILKGAATRAEPPAAAALSPEVRTSWRVDLETFSILARIPGWTSRGVRSSVSAPSSVSSTPPASSWSRAQVHRADSSCQDRGSWTSWRSGAGPASLPPRRSPGHRPRVGRAGPSGGVWSHRSRALRRHDRARVGPPRVDPGPAGSRGRGAPRRRTFATGPRRGRRGPDRATGGCGGGARVATGPGCAADARG